MNTIHNNKKQTHSTIWQKWHNIIVMATQRFLVVKTSYQKHNKYTSHKMTMLHRDGLSLMAKGNIFWWLLSLQVTQRDIMRTFTSGCSFCQPMTIMYGLFSPNSLQISPFVLIIATVLLHHPWTTTNNHMSMPKCLPYQCLELG